MITEKQENHLKNVTQFLKKLQLPTIIKELNKLNLEDINIWEIYEGKTGFKINCDFYHKDGRLITPNYSRIKIDIIRKIRDLFSILDGYESKDVSYEWKTKSNVSLKIDEKLEERLIELFLSPELQALYHYKQLSNELTQKSSNKKKIKI